MTSASPMHEAGHSKLVLWDYPEGWGGGDSGWGDTCAPVADACRCIVYLSLLLKKKWHDSKATKIFFMQVFIQQVFFQINLF